MGATPLRRAGANPAKPPTRAWCLVAELLLYVIAAEVVNWSMGTWAVP
jgi:hypothetical protein